MQFLHDFLAGIEWWRLTPAHDLILNQPDDVTRRMVLARTAKGDLAVAYLPNNDAIEIDTSVFRASLAARWFDPVTGHSTSIEGRIDNEGRHRFAPPAKGDWVLHLQRTAE
jgi:Putative collagen-binding domain of a collagenase